MRYIETKEKGDIGVSLVIADLAIKGVKVALPMSEHLPFDIICINSSCKLARISVKFTSINKRGGIEVPLRTISSNSKGYNFKYLNHDDIDAFAVFCPQTNKCYYVPKTRYAGNKTTFIIRPEEDLSNPDVLFN